jgi:hypothetical protein
MEDEYAADYGYINPDDAPGVAIPKRALREALVSGALKDVNSLKSYLAKHCTSATVTGPLMWELEAFVDLEELISDDTDYAVGFDDYLSDAGPAAPAPIAIDGKKARKERPRQPKQTAGSLQFDSPPPLPSNPADDLVAAINVCRDNQGILEDTHMCVPTLCKSMRHDC